MGNVLELQGSPPPSRESEMTMRLPISSILFTAVLVLVTPSLAKKKPPHIEMTGRCDCACLTPGGLTSSVTVESEGYACAAFDNKTCNVADPATGGIRSGKTLACQESMEAPGSSGTAHDPGTPPAPSKVKPKAPLGGNAAE